MSVPATEAPSSTHWPTVLTAIGLGWLSAVAVGKMPPALPLLRTDLGLGLVAAGWLTSLIGLTGAFGAIAVGAFSSRARPVPMLAVALGCLALGALLGASGWVWPLFLGRLLQSAGFILVIVTAPRLIAVAVAQRDRGAVFASWGTYLPGGSVVGMLSFPFLADWLGWRGYWLAYAVVVALFAVLALPRLGGGVPQPQASSMRHTLTQSLSILRRPMVWLLSLCFACYTVQYFAVTTWLPTFLVEEQGASVTKAALATALVVAVNVLGNLAAGWLMHRGVRATTLMAAALMLMAGASVAVFDAGAPETWRVPAAMALTAVGGMLPGSVLASANALANNPAQVSTANGAVLQGANVGNLLGPPLLASALPLVGGWHKGWVVLVVFALAGLAMVALLRWALEDENV